MSGKQVWGQQRAVWDLAKERVLLEVFEQTRHDGVMRTDRGLKSRGWSRVAEDMNKRCGTTFNVDQLKSKHARLMMDYELFKDVGGERSLSDQVWDKLILDMPENAKRLRQFKDEGFPHADVCRRISIAKETLRAVKQAKPAATTVAAVTTVKRPSALDAELPEPKRVEIGSESEAALIWTTEEEEMLLFLCWKEKSDREKLPKDGVERKVWHEVTAEMNTHFKTNLSKQQVKDKYLELMQVYDQFKRATGFPAHLERPPKGDEDWNLLLQSRPQFSEELQRLKNMGGFPHIEVSSLIAGDKPTNGTEAASLGDFLVTGTLQRPKASDVPSEQQSVDAEAKAPDALLGGPLPRLLPKPASLSTPPRPTTANTQPVPAAGPAPQPSGLTQELHDNLNMFLKTATAYLVMLINDHNQESEA